MTTKNLPAVIDDNLPDVIDQFVAAVAPRRRAKTGVTENDDFLAWVWRMVRSMTHRAIDNPEMLEQIGKLGDRCAEIQNIAIAINAERYRRDQHTGFSIGEMHRAMGISRQAVQQRRARGVELIRQHIAAIEAGGTLAAIERAARTPDDDGIIDAEVVEEAAS